MTDDRQRWPGPPDAEIADLLALAADTPPAPSGARGRVMARVAASVALPAAGVPELLSTGSSTTATGAGAGSASTTAGAASASLSTAVAAGGLLGASGAWVAVLGAVAATTVAAGIWFSTGSVETSERGAPVTEHEAIPDALDPPPTPVTQPEAKAPAELAPVEAAPTEVAARPTVEAAAALDMPATNAEPRLPAADAHRTPRARRPSPTPRPQTRDHGARQAPHTTPRSTVAATADQPVSPTIAPTPTTPAPAVRDAALSAERSLLVDAVRALERGRSDAAGRALDLHEQRFPAGRLADERALLRIRWLLATGRESDARAAADAFRKRVPDGFLRPAVDALVPPETR